MNVIAKRVTAALEAEGYSVDYDEDGTFLNIARLNGTSCEFEMVILCDCCMSLFATYRVNNRKRDFGFEIVEYKGLLRGDYLKFMATVRKILA